MTRDVLCIESRQLLPYAWSVMVKERIRHLPVVEEGRLVGILSDRDVLARSTFESDMLFVPTVKVADVMTRTVVTLGPDASVTQICDAMLKDKIDSVPIVDGERLVGLLTSSDLIFLLRTAEELERPRGIPFEFSLRTIEGDASYDEGIPQVPSEIRDDGGTP